MRGFLSGTGKGVRTSRPPPGTSGTVKPSGKMYGRRTCRAPQEHRFQPPAHMVLQPDFTALISQHMQPSAISIGQCQGSIMPEVMAPTNGEAQQIYVLDRTFEAMERVMGRYECNPHPWKISLW